MPRTDVRIYRELDGTVPLLEWQETLTGKVQNKCFVLIEKLAECGHELRRPLADYLRDGVYELRVKHRHDQFRILYFFHGREAVVLSHGLRKERRVPDREIDLAVRRMRDYMRNPGKHTHEIER